MKTSLAALGLIGAIGAGSALAADKLQLVPPERLANYWLVDQQNGAMAPNSGGRNLYAPSCVAISYVIDKTGATSHIKLERVVPDGDLGKVGVSVVQGLHYQANAKNNSGKDAVYTYVVLPFNLADAKTATPAERSERARVLGACKLDDFKLPTDAAQH